MSDDIYEALSSLDPVLRHPTRFAIITLLIVSGPQTEGDISKKLRISGGPLSTHIKRLVEAGYVEAKKYPTLRGPRTYIIVTEKGVKAYHEYVSLLERIVDKARRAREKEEKK
ncbi:MAG: hypothetical protein DRJ35_04720 [Thermoprotei archaeon]|nr:MAG: hypothetical protein DRJ35_04720 [Thermoprotei archaeon]